MAQAMIMRRGGGGGLSALKVTAVANYASLPTSPKLYQMCIVSATAVANVFLSNTAPASPATGDVQIGTGYANTQPIYLDKDGRLAVYPTNAYQYNGTAWIAVDLYTWDGTEWVPPWKYLIQAGVDNAGVGGTLTTKAGTNLIQYTGYKYFASGELRKPNAIDVTPYRVLKIYGRSEYTTGRGYVRMSIDSSNAQEVTLGTSDAIYSIDLSAQTGMRYLGLSAANPAYIFDWWLE